MYIQKFKLDFLRNYCADLNQILHESFPAQGNENLLTQGCHGQGKKSGKWNFFQVREKSGNFNFSQGNLEKMIKVREKSGNLRSFPKSLW